MLDLGITLIFIGVGILACASLMQSRRALLCITDAAADIPVYTGPIYNRHGREVVL